MKVCFDTSILVASLIQKHPHHGTAFPYFQAVRTGSNQGFLNTHGLAEPFASLTDLPLKPRLLPSDVERLIDQSVLRHFELIPIGPAEYRDALRLVVMRNLASASPIISN